MEVLLEFFEDGIKLVRLTKLMLFHQADDLFLGLFDRFEHIRGGADQLLLEGPKVACHLGQVFLNILKPLRYQYWLIRVGSLNLERHVEIGLSHTSANKFQDVGD